MGCCTRTIPDQTPPRPHQTCPTRSADAHCPTHRLELHGRRLRRCRDISLCRGGGNFIGTATVGQDEWRAAALARHQCSQLRPLPACRAADFYDHRSFSAVKFDDVRRIPGRCHDRDRFSAVEGRPWSATLEHPTWLPLRAGWSWTAVDSRRTQGQAVPGNIR
jgi:hypothetical protein